MNKLQVFNNEKFGQVRTIEINGKVLFAGSDVAKALGYAIPSKAVNTHCKGVSKMEVGVQTGMKTDGTPAIQNIEMLFIPEGDLYRLAAKSELPGAEEFEAWIFDEVLPSIRENGGYILNQEKLTPEQIVANALLVAQNIISAKDKLLEEQRPKVLFADAVETSHTSILIGDLAKLIKQNGVDIGQKRLFAWMRDNGYLIKGGTSINMPTQKGMDLGLFEVRERTINNPDGSARITRTTKITGKGQSYFINKLLPEKRAI